MNAETTVADLQGAEVWRAAGALFERFGLALVEVPPGEEIPGSHWGDREAGLVGDRIYARRDTPIHSLLHEGVHWVCMDRERRARLDTDAGGDDVEESAVCYLAILVAGELPGFGSERMFRDMDAWGYSFRLGSSRAWFEDDAEDAVAWLRQHGLIGDDGRPTWQRRENA